MLRIGKIWRTGVRLPLAGLKSAAVITKDGNDVNDDSTRRAIKRPPRELAALVSRARVRVQTSASLSH
jgi:hypothetical protein